MDPCTTARLSGVQGSMDDQAFISTRSKAAIGQHHMCRGATYVEAGNDAEQADRTRRDGRSS